MGRGRHACGHPGRAGGVGRGVSSRLNPPQGVSSPYAQEYLIFLRCAGEEKVTENEQSSHVSKNMAQLLLDQL